MEGRMYFRFMLPILFFCVGCQGMELTLSHDWSLEGRKGCGVVLCEEIIQNLGVSRNSTPDNATSRDDSAMGGNKIVSSDFVTEMLIFKHAQQPPISSRDRSDIAQKRLIASLTSKYPQINRVSDGIKVDGKLMTGGATLRLGLYKQNDCQAEYTCKVTVMDSNGNNHVTSSHLLQQHATQEGRIAKALGESTDVILTVISLLHEIDNNLVQIGHETDSSWQTRLQALENRFEDRLVAIENRLEDKIQSMENRLENKLEKFGDRLEDKTALLERNLEDRLGQFHDKLEDNIKEKMKVGLIGLESKLTASLQSGMSMVQSAQQVDGVCSKDTDKMLLNISIVSQESTRHLKGQLDIIDQSLEQKFQNLSSSISDIITAPDCSSFCDVLSETRANISEAVHAAILDTLTLKSCARNGISVLPHPSYPYPVVRPNKETTFAFPYLCDTFTDGGGWIVIQRRSSGKVDFFRTWEEYKNGFGSLDDDFWLGNEKIHIITNSATYELRITLKYKGVTKYAHYNSISLSGEQSNYILNVGTYDGTAGDALNEHRGKQFSTKDRENDSHSTLNCATRYQGAWWYNACHNANLNGQWGANDYRGPSWHQWARGEPMTFTEMKIRLVDDS